MRPRIVDLRDEPRDTGRWLAKGRLVPRLPFTKGVGGGGFRYQTPRHAQMKARDNSLDDIEGRLQDLATMEVDFVSRASYAARSRKCDWRLLALAEHLSMAERPLGYQENFRRY